MVKIDYLEKLHRYSVEEVAAFSDSKSATFHQPGTGMYFYSASHIENLIYSQQARITELQSSLNRIKLAHDKLFNELQKLRKKMERIPL